MKKRIFKNMEWWIVIWGIALCIIGLIALFSATSEANYNEFSKQIIWIVISIVAMFIVMMLNYNILVKTSPVLYGISIILLILVLFTEPINGATSWFSLGDFAFQPSEFAKIAVILFIAFANSKIQENGKEQINKPWNLLIVLAIVALPILLILMQPDYGTAAAYITALALILFTSGINKKYIIVTILLIVVIAPIIYIFFLPDHAKTRIDVFLNPESDPRGAGYNVIQSKLAIGAGRLWGMGLLKGNQTQLGYLYPKTTDFIFAVIGEEMGFIVASCIIILYVLIITKIIYIAKTAKDDEGSYIAIGIAGIFLFHMLENIGMTMGLLPITGVPLLFVSYGGSSMINSFICLGILLNISGNRQKTIFVK
jgi:rod shape determining protein RodA